MSRPKERGRWHRGHSDLVAAVQAEAEAFGWPPSKVIQTLYERRLLPAPNYYAPTLDEVYDMMTALRHATEYGGMPARWVMCAETIAAFHRQYREMVAPEAPPLWAFLPAEDEADATFPDALRVIDRSDGMPKLFGVPIRTDPAARTPLFEINPDGG